MTDTIVLVLIAAAAISLGVSLLAYRAATEAVRIARSGAGSGGMSLAGGGSRADRDAGKRLAQRAGALLAKVNAFPPALLGPGADGKVREAVLWTAAEVASLRDVTPVLLRASGESLAAVEPAMAWLLQQGEMIRSTPRGSGQYLIDFPHDTWRRNYQGALSGLQELVTRGEAVAK
jgi:hypothetical protein